MDAPRSTRGRPKGTHNIKDFKIIEPSEVAQDHPLRWMYEEGVFVKPSHPLDDQFVPEHLPERKQPQ